jgi:hypothetical protein
MDMLGITGIIIALTAAFLGVKQVVIPIIKRINLACETASNFSRDWNGEPASPGREASPGVMERLNRLDGELTHNGGKSIKDVVCRMEANQQKLWKKIEEVEKKRLAAHNEIISIIRETNGDSRIYSKDTN